MTSKRSQAVALAQGRVLRRLAVARDRRPGPLPATINPSEALGLAVLASAEHLTTLARLARMGGAVATDDHSRMVIVILNAVVNALADDIRSGGTAAIDELYKRTTTITTKEEFE